MIKLGSAVTVTLITKRQEKRKNLESKLNKKGHNILAKIHTFPLGLKLEILQAVLEKACTPLKAAIFDISEI